MRPIRFRAWDGEKMIDDFVLDWRQGFICTSDGKYHSFAPTSPNAKYKLMQATGLSDKNGTPIFEGDIVRYKDRWQYRVEYRPPFFLITWGDEYQPLPASSADDIEILGNVHEHPHLLSNSGTTRESDNTK